MSLSWISTNLSRCKGGLNTRDLGSRAESRTALCPGPTGSAPLGCAQAPVPSAVVSGGEGLHSEPSAGTSCCHRSQESSLLDSLVCLLPTATSCRSSGAVAGEVGSGAPCEAPQGVSCPSPAATQHRHPHHPDRRAVSQGAPLFLPGDSQDDASGALDTRHEPEGPSSPHRPRSRRPTCSSARAGAAPRGRRVSRGFLGAAPRRGPLRGSVGEEAAGVGASRRAGAGTRRPLAHKGGGGKAGRGGPGAGAAGRGGGRAGADKAPAAATAAGERSWADGLLGLC